MEWTSVIADLATGLVTGLVGTMVGVFLGIRVEARSARKAEAARERRSLQAVMDRVAAKRAFRPSGVTGPGFGNGPDRERCIASVLDTRERLASAAESIHSLTGVDEVLRDMESACSAYLSYANQFPDRYAMGLMALRQELWRHMTILGDAVPELRIQEPGQRTLEVPVWLEGPS